MAGDVLDEIADQAERYFVGDGEVVALFEVQNDVDDIDGIKVKLFVEAGARADALGADPLVAHNDAHHFAGNGGNGGGIHCENGVG